MKRTIILLLITFLVGCSSTTPEPTTTADTTSLPPKTNAEDVLMGESPITTKNIDEYLFRDDTVYIDTRTAEQFNKEGHIAGFVNVPFYEIIAHIKTTNNVLYTMDKLFNEDGTMKTGLGDIDSFFANYEESEEILNDIFPKNKNIVFMSTAGVEASYTMNLLLQLGYDGNKLYNGGGFSNSVGMGENQKTAYIELEDPKHLIRAFLPFTYNIVIEDRDLTKIQQ